MSPTTKEEGGPFNGIGDTLNEPISARDGLTPVETPSECTSFLRTAVALVAAVSGVVCLVSHHLGAPSVSIVSGFLLVLLGWGAPFVPKEHFQSPAVALPRIMLWGISIAILVSFALVETRSDFLDPAFQILSGAVVVWSLSVLRRTNWRHIASAGQDIRRATGTATSWAIIALPIASIVLSVVAGIVAMPASPGLEGYFTSLNAFWFAAVLLAFVALAKELRQPRHGVLTISAFIAAFSLSPAIAYVEPRYPYAAKHVGVTSYIASHQFVTPHLDIYQAWPGMFSSVAMLVRGTGFTDIYALARFWVPGIDFLTTLAVASLISRFTSRSSAITLGAIVFFLANSIGQDYYSPQSIGFLLAFGVVIILLECSSIDSKLGRIDLFLTIVISCALAVTHQLSPYLATLVVLVLVVFGLIRPRWSPLIVLLPAVLWAAINQHYVREYLNPAQFGHITQNIQTRGSVAYNAKDPWQYACQYAELIGVLIPGVIFLLVWYERRDKTSAALALCALSPTALFFASSYGNESAFRVALFALPWICVGLARSRNFVHRGYQFAMVAATVALAVTYAFANLGFAAIQVVSPPQAVAEGLFETTAPRGSILIQLGLGSGPVQLTANYTDFHFGSFRAMRSTPPREFVQKVLPYLHEDTSGRGGVYLISSHAAATYSALDNGMSIGAYDNYVAALKMSPRIQTLYSSGDVTYMKYARTRDR